MHSHPLLRYFFLVVTLALLAFCNMLHPGLSRLRDEHNLRGRFASQSAPPEYIITHSLLGGVRGIVFMFLFHRAQTMRDEGQYYDMVDSYRLITRLMPNFPSAWAFISWDLAYNVSYPHENPTQRAYWVFEGINLLRNEGIANNPRNPGLYHELSWMLFHKIEDQTDTAFYLYRRKLRYSVERIFLGSGTIEDLRNIIAARNQLGPTGLDYSFMRYDPRLEEAARTEFLQNEQVTALAKHLEALGFDLFEQAGLLLRGPEQNGTPLARARELYTDPETRAIVETAMYWEMGRRLKSELNMDVELMLSLSERFAEIDWRIAPAHSLYWGWLGQIAYGQKWGTSNPNLRFTRLIYFALQRLAYKGDPMISLESDNPQGQETQATFWGLPNKEFVDPTINYMLERIEYYEHLEQDVNTNGPRVSLENFMRSLVLSFYFLGDMEMAVHIQERLVRYSPAPDFEGTLDEFVARHVRRMIQKDQQEGLLIPLVFYCREAYMALAEGAPEGYLNNRKFFEDMYAAFRQRYTAAADKSEGIGTKQPFPPILRLRVQAALLLYDYFGQTGYPLQYWQNFIAALKGQEPETYAALSQTLSQKQSPAPQPKPSNPGQQQ